MHVITDPQQMTASFGGAFVPTMGALHEGHRALMRRAAPLAQPLVISIFVNPTQFGPGEDWERYPRPLDADLAAAEAAGVDVVFAPSVETIYPPDTEIPVPPLDPVATEPGLEDAHRPGHFAGVCQVVARLFDLVRPSVAVFGEKDYQQLLVIRAMARREADRWPGLRVVAHPTIRDADGLAVSSRNAYLKGGQRERAAGLWRALERARETVDGGGGVREAEDALHAVLADHELQVEYAVVRDAATLMPVARLDASARALIAARLGDVRLIDNLQVGEVENRKSKVESRNREPRPPAAAE